MLGRRLVRKSYEKKSDEDLARLFRQGDRGAWRVLIDRYDRPVMGVVVGMTNITAQHLRSLAPGGSQGWLLDFFNLLFNEAADELKGLDTDLEDFAVWLYCFILKRLQRKGPPPFRISPAWASDKDEAVLAALVCLGEQYPRYQKAVVLKAYAKRWSLNQRKLIDLTYEQIGKILVEDPVDPPSPACVKNWYQRGLEKIEEYLISGGWL